MPITHEINAVVETLKDAYPNRVNVLFFNPDLYTRTRDFMNGFAAALAQYDRVILLPIYPARELPIEGISSTVLADKIMQKTR